MVQVLSNLLSLKFKSFSKILLPLLITTFMFIQVNTEYPKKIDCSEEEMKKGLKEAFGALGRWVTEINAAKFEKRQTDQLKTFQKFLSDHVLEYENTSLLVQAMLCTAPNTSPVERGYAIIQMVTSKRKNRITSKNLDVLFLLGTLKIAVKNPEDYENERKRLEKKK